MSSPSARRPGSTAALERTVADHGDVPLDWRHKGFTGADSTIGELRASSRPLSSLGSPLMIIDRSAVHANITGMNAWCAERGAVLAPHGKTTMAPSLWLDQLRAGCVAITVANAFQLRVARAVGVPDLIVANELVDPRELAWIGTELDRDPAFGLTCWVDSVAGVELMQQALTGHGSRPLDVCVEVGGVGGRAGARDPLAVRAVAEAVVAADRLRLAGISCYEGAVPGIGADAAGLATVDAFLESVVELHHQLTELYESDRPVITAGGSSHFDRVAAAFGGLDGVDVVIRSGAYAVHDDLHYAQVTPSTRGAGPEFVPAISTWATVLSRPEPGRVIIDAGRRDVPFDQDLPIVLDARRRTDDGLRRIDPGATTVISLNDQHGYLDVAADSELEVGDLVRLGLSHPCTAFDKWRVIGVVESNQPDDPTVVDAVLTYF
ncbi:amino acid deaminase [Microlunatus speluncae]|uniref:amino acid deaminase n=1 Tax=Microlunatus speluncae TaxID=2594267 RepID=UPI001266333D|nr:amino acid deaminase [Microlunatus speluncae]